MPERIRLSRSSVGELEKTALSGVIDQDYLGMGSFVREFEEAIGEWLSAGTQAVCVSSGTAALHLATEACVPPGAEVLVQSLTFVASFQAISAAGAVPVPCEVDPATCTVDIKDAERKLTGRTRAIMPVHYAGRPGELEEVYRFAQRHGLRVIEDAAHAFGSVYKGRKIGSFGDIVCFSFDGIKNITSGEGGAVVTADAEVASRVKDARLLGVRNDSEKRYRGARSWEFDVARQGYRYHMSNLFAAIGAVQLKRLDGEFAPARQRLARAYHEALRWIPWIALFPDDYAEIVPHIFPVRVLGGRRDSLREHLANCGVESGVHYYPNHLLSFYGGRAGELPVTERLFGELLSLPLHPGLTEAQQGSVIEGIKEFYSARRP
ncbi:MAG TPA: aminotransferase [Deltaproteobacteria bacterium]|nr:MAG: aminotransferase [Deltaproteobacteria bacterium GWA2_55_82]OGQ63479.1 MAG: aminotransferase [Deltaproteobacteria bacterium RIFCSPLOWO2_02_FULL_55_12]OIJ74860.1 MAG: aminotransferase [Deltaproteobacteria bacterium GWC2_55_46]HBG47491.1 aminotransferase [Deltaproteobacteria bacterium]HCY11507.1 aminotransferase [Deltaproteobacteria bacterium]